MGKKKYNKPDIAQARQLSRQPEFAGCDVPGTGSAPIALEVVLFMLADRIGKLQKRLEKLEGATGGLDVPRV